MEFNKPIIQTLAYSDIFDYSLTKDELWRFLHSDKAISKKSFETFLQKKYFQKFLYNHGYYCLTGRASIIKERLGKKENSQRKYLLAQKIAARLAIIPTIQCIGLSGSVAVANAKIDDDIDFFVITKKGTIWMTRFLIFFLLFLFQKGRKRNDKDTKDKICCNFFLDESKISFPKERQDIYTAHEVVQLVPLFVRNNMYIRFLSANSWVIKYLPNAFENKKINRETKFDTSKKNLFFSLLETTLKKIQLWYMSEKKGDEQISATLLAFHPYDYRKKVLQLYEKNIKKYEAI